MRYAAILLLVLSPALVGQTTAPTRPTTRHAADGADYPPAGPRRVQVTLPIVGNCLGGLPEELAPKVMSVARSRPEFQRLFRQRLEADYFTGRTPPADALAVNLTDGRISRVSIVFHAVTPQRMNQIRQILGPFAPGDGSAISTETTIQATNELSGQQVPLRVALVRQAGSGGGRPVDRGWVRVSVEADPVEWHLLHHDVDPAVAQALRQGALVRGMTFDEAVLIKGKPPHTTPLGPGRMGYAWPEYVDDLKTIRLLAGDVQTYNRTIDKVTVIVVQDGVIEKVEERDYEGPPGAVPKPVPQR